MSKFRGTNAEKRLEALKKALSFVCMTAHADEQGNDPTPNNGAQNQPNPINYEQLIAQARKEEKEKLYPKIKKLEEENKSLVVNGNENLIKIAELSRTVEEQKKTIADLQSKEADTQTVKDLKAQIETLTAENKKLKEETPNEEEIRKQIEAEYEVKLYLKEQTAANKDSILSSFLTDVQGKTKEEIDASIQAAKDKSLAIKKELGLVDDEGNPINNSKPNKQVKPKKNNSTDNNSNSGENHAPATNPTSDSGSNINYDPEYIRNLDPRSEEYKEFRKSLGLK